jgi:hypothetical protein
MICKLPRGPRPNFAVPSPPPLRRNSQWTPQKYHFCHLFSPGLYLCRNHLIILFFSLLLVPYSSSSHLPIPSAPSANYGLRTLRLGSGIFLSGAPQKERAASSQSLTSLFCEPGISRTQTNPFGSRRPSPIKPSPPRGITGRHLMISRIMQSIAPAPSHHNQVHLHPPRSLSSPGRPSL